MARAVIFDHYGVVGHDPLAAWRQQRRLSDEDWGCVQKICQASDAGKIELWGPDGFYTQLGHLVGLDEKVVHQELEAAVTFNRDLLTIIDELHAAHVKVGLLSNSGKTLHDTLQQHHIRDYFDDVLTSAEAGAVKPQPAIFHQALSRLGVQAQEAFFFDDRQVNVDGARRAGLSAELFTDASQCRLVLKHAGFLS